VDQINTISLFSYDLMLFNFQLFWSL